MLEKVSGWGSVENTMFVVGATKANELKKIRSIVPNHFLLIPGVGAQGGDLNEVVNNGITSDIGLIVNSSRGIIYAGQGEDFDMKSRAAAKEMQQQMAKFL